MVSLVVESQVRLLTVDRVPGCTVLGAGASLHSTNWSWVIFVHFQRELAVAKERFLSSQAVLVFDVFCNRSACS